MSFGRMNTHISIAEVAVTKDAEGFATKTDNILASVHAYREGRHGSKKMVKRAAVKEATALLSLTVVTNLNGTTAHVILCGDERFDITSVEDVKGRKMYLELLGKRMMADG